VQPLAVKILLDSCVSELVGYELRELGPDVVWVGDWIRDPGDSAILEIAHREERVLVTIDKDFGELAVVHRMPHSGIIRLVDLPPSIHAQTCHEIVMELGEELAAGAIVTAEVGRWRIRPPEEN
jgi:predicted nuclease of predicted toxin-antitoxin system